jgi:hypothetical protein
MGGGMGGFSSNNRIGGLSPLVSLRYINIILEISI